MKYIPYPLYSNFYCNSYIKYLDKIKIGNKYQFNVWFFFFNIFWLARHKMYIHISLISTLLLIPFVYLGSIANLKKIEDLSQINELEEARFALLLFTAMYIMLSFLTHYFYHIKNLNQIDYNSPDPLRKIKPLNLLLVVPVALSILFATNLLTTVLIIGLESLLKML